MQEPFARNQRRELVLRAIGKRVFSVRRRAENSDREFLLAFLGCRQNISDSSPRRRFSSCGLFAVLACVDLLQIFLDLRLSIFLNGIYPSLQSTLNRFEIGSRRGIAGWFNWLQRVARDCGVDMRIERIVVHQCTFDALKHKTGPWPVGGFL